MPRFICLFGILVIGLSTAAAQVPDHQVTAPMGVEGRVGASSETCTGKLADPRVRTFGNELADRLGLGVVNSSNEQFTSSLKTEDDVFALFLGALQAKLERSTDWQDPLHTFAGNLKRMIGAHAWLGVQIQTLNAAAAVTLGIKVTQGAMVVRNPEPDSPAGLVGIQFGDVITEINDQPIKAVSDVLDLVKGSTPGAIVSVQLIRKDTPKTLSVRLGVVGADGQQITNVVDPQTIKKQLLSCFPELQRVIDAAKSRQDKIAESVHTQQQAAQEQGVPDCRTALSAALRGYNPVIENVLSAIQAPEVQSLAKEISHGLEDETVTLADASNPSVALAHLLEKFRSELRARVAALPAGRTTIVLQSWLSNMGEPEMISCFPAIIPVARAFAAKLRVASDDVRQRQAESAAQAQAPRNVLGRAYASYMFIKRCYDAREGYAAVYISQPEMEQARSAVRQIEEFIKPKLDSGTTADQIWQQTTVPEANIFQRTTDFQTGISMLCHHRLAELLALLQQEIPESGKIKKDF